MTDSGNWYYWYDNVLCTGLFRFKLFRYDFSVSLRDLMLALVPFIVLFPLILLLCKCKRFLWGQRSTTEVPVQESSQTASTSHIRGKALVDDIKLKRRNKKLAIPQPGEAKSSGQKRDDLVDFISKTKTGKEHPVVHASSAGPSRKSKRNIVAEPEGVDLPDEAGDRSALGVEGAHGDQTSLRLLELLRVTNLSSAELREIIAILVERNSETTKWIQAGLEVKSSGDSALSMELEQKSIELKELTKKWRDADREKVDLQKRVDMFEKDLPECDKRNSDLLDENASLILQLNQLKKEHDTSMTALKLELETMQSENSAYQSSIKDLKKELTNARKHPSNHKSTQTAAQKPTYEHLQQKCTELTSDVTSKVETIKTLETTISQLQQQTQTPSYAELQQECHRVTSEMAVQTVLRTTHESTITQLRQQLNAVESANAEALQRSTSSSQDEVIRLTLSMEQLQIRLTAAIEEGRQHKEALDQANQNLKDRESSIQRLESESQTCLQNLCQKELNNNQLTDQLKTLTKTFETTRTQNETLVTKLTEMEYLLATEKQKSQKQDQTLLAKTETDWNQLTHAHSRLEATLVEVKELRETITRLETELGHATECSSHLEITNDELQQKLAATIKEWEIKYETLTVDKDHTISILTGENSLFKQQLAEATQLLARQPHLKTVVNEKDALLLQLNSIKDTHKQQITILQSSITEINSQWETKYNSLRTSTDQTAKSLNEQIVSLNGHMSSLAQSSAAASEPNLGTLIEEKTALVQLVSSLKQQLEDSRLDREKKLNAQHDEHAKALADVKAHYLKMAEQQTSTPLFGPGTSIDFSSPRLAADESRIVAGSHSHNTIAEASSSRDVDSGVVSDLTLETEVNTLREANMQLQKELMSQKKRSTKRKKNQPTPATLEPAEEEDSAAVMEELEIEVMELREAKEFLEMEVERLQQDQASTNQPNERTSATNDDVEELKRQLEDMLGEVMGLRETNEFLESKLRAEAGHDLDPSVETGNQNGEELKRQLEDLEIEAMELREANDFLESERNRMQEEITELSNKDEAEDKGELKIQFEELEIEAMELREANEFLESERNRLQEEVAGSVSDKNTDELKKKLEAANFEACSLREENEFLDSERLRLQEKIAEIQSESGASKGSAGGNEVEQMRSQHVAAEERIKQLTVDLSKADSFAKKLRISKTTEIAELQAEKKSLQSRVTQLEEQAVAKVDSSNTKTVKVIDPPDTASSDCSSDVVIFADYDRLKTSLKAKQEECDAKSDQVNQLMDENAGLISRVDALEATMTMRRTELLELGSRVNACCSTVVQASNDRQQEPTSSKRTDDLNAAKIAYLGRRVSELGSASSITKQPSQEKPKTSTSTEQEKSLLATLQVEVEHKSQEISELREKLKETERLRQNVEQSAKLSETAVRHEFEASQSDKEQRLKSLEVELEQSKAAALQSSIKASGNAQSNIIGELQNTISGLQEKLGIEQQDGAKLQTELEELKAKLAASQDELTKLKSELNKVLSEKANVGKELDDLQTTKTRLTEELDESQSLLRETDTEHQLVLSELEDLRRQSDEGIGRINILETHLTEINSTKLRLEAEKLELQTKAKDMSVECEELRLVFSFLTPKCSSSQLRHFVNSSMSLWMNKL